MPLENGLQEGEIRTEREAGGHIRSLFVVERPGLPDEPSDYVVYIRPSWSRGYRILRTWRDRGDRKFRDFTRMLQTVRELGHDGPVMVYKAGCEQLRRFRGVYVEDGGGGEPDEDTPETP